MKLENILKSWACNLSSKKCCLFIIPFLTIEISLLMLSFIKKHLPALVAISLTGSIVYLWFVFGESNSSLSPDELGSAYGTLTTLFTGIGLTFLFYTIIVQEREMKATRDEMISQQIENHVFQMLGVLNSIINEIHLTNRSSQKEFDGRRAFKTFFKNFKEKFTLQIKSTNQEEVIAEAHFYKNHSCEKFKDELVENMLNKAWEEFWEDHNVWLAHYFRYLSRLLDFIDESSLTTDKKKSLVTIATAQMSDYELVMLLYFLKFNKNGKLFNLCSKYKLLEHINYSLLICKEHIPQQNQL